MQFGIYQIRLRKMALSKKLLSQELQALSKEMRSKGADTPDSFWADKLADIITKHIQRAEVIVEPGQPVSSPSGAGVTTGNGKGRLI